MKRWKVVFLVNNVHSEQIVSATGGFEARKIVESQYAGQKVVILRVEPAR